MLNLDFAGDRSSCEVLPSISVTKIKKLDSNQTGIYGMYIHKTKGEFKGLLV